MEIGRAAGNALGVRLRVGGRLLGYAVVAAAGSELCIGGAIEKTEAMVLVIRHVISIPSEHELVMIITGRRPLRRCGLLGHEKIVVKCPIFVYLLPFQQVRRICARRGEYLEKFSWVYSAR